MTVRVVGTEITGELECGLGADVVFKTERLGFQQLPASAVEVVKGGEDEETERLVINAARVRGIQPLLPECAEPATVFIEVYSARRTLHGSLDATVSTCEAHASAAVDAVHAQKLTAYRSHATLVSKRTCGHVYDHTLNTS